MRIWGLVNAGNNAEEKEEERKLREQSWSRRNKHRGSGGLQDTNVKCNQGMINLNVQLKIWMPADVNDLISRGVSSLGVELPNQQDQQKQGEGGGGHAARLPRYINSTLCQQYSS